MRFKTTNWPKKQPLHLYEETIRDLSSVFQNQPGFISLYQMGSITQPGISDINLIAVFADNQSFNKDPIQVLPAEKQLLFTHNIFGISSTYFAEIQKVSLFHNYKHIAGNNFLEQPTGQPAVSPFLKKQVALEYLLANYIARSVESIYGVLSVRNLLLSVKAIRYDMEFMNITHGALMEAVDQIWNWRENWFSSKPNPAAFTQWFKTFYQALDAFLFAYLKSNPIYLPEWTHGRYSRHITIQSDNRLKYSHRGVIFPPTITVKNKKLLRIQNRFSHFTFSVPITHQAPEPLLEYRMKLYQKIKSYHKKHFKYLSPLSSNFTWRII